ncbi:RDD family protein [Streptomyces sp. GC420]|uniref:RDD family protein n=1 Tax=Streptomyces sp. GC420 TaxID=2697568 RepID=UPI001414FCC3|nr:RDD family protein [Streptomyces sp. GC420]NBM15983.1 RDD family protein [Streptomyces sp. GC420]
MSTPPQYPGGQGHDPFQQRPYPPRHQHPQYPAQPQQAYGQAHPGPPAPYQPYQPPYGYGQPYAPWVPPYAGWWRRAGAWALDVLVVFGSLYGPIGLAALIGSSDEGTAAQVTANVVAVLGLVAFVAVIVYQLRGEGRTGQTLGKRALGIRVLGERDGQPLGIGTALLRRLAQAVNGFVFGLGWLWAAWDVKKQTFADKMVGAVVVRALG